MTGKLALIVLLSLALGCAPGPAGAGETGVGEAIDLCRYRIVFADEFDDLAVAPRRLEGGARWTAHTPWNGDFGDAMFSDPRADWPFTVQDGILTIAAFRDETGRWRSGLLAAADETGAGHGVRYGYFEARMKFPPGPGTWPAFWLMSLQPASRKPKVEIDVVEYYGHRADRYFTAQHVWFADGDKRQAPPAGTHIKVADGSLVDAFHRYGVRVDPLHVTYYLDGTAVWQHPTPAELDTPLYPLVNLALGSGYSIEDTPDPSHLQVDYVRVYEPLGPHETTPDRCDSASAAR